MRFRKKPVIIEAFQFDPEKWKNPSQFQQMPDWLLDAVLAHDVIKSDNCCIIKTLEGNHQCSPGDWIIRGIKGELYPCKPDVFEATYEPVENFPMTTDKLVE